MSAGDRRGQAKPSPRCQPAPVHATDQPFTAHNIHTFHGMKPKVLVDLNHGHTRWCGLGFFCGGTNRAGPGPRCGRGVPTTGPGSAAHGSTPTAGTCTAATLAKQRLAAATARFHRASLVGAREVPGASITACKRTWQLVPSSDARPCPQSHGDLFPSTTSQ